VVANDDLPMPPSVTEQNARSPEEQAVYSIWLMINGPPMWRLQGLSLLAEAAETKYMAWKVWRGVLSSE